MKKVVVIICVLSGLQCFAQSDTVRLEKVEISASRLPVVYSAEIRPVGLLKRKDILAAPVRNADDIFLYERGFDFRQRGVNGAQADLSINGGSFEQNLILINGINMNDPQTGHHNFDLPVDLEQAERIELLRGPGALLYGANAFAGVVNIITPESVSGHLNISVSGGDFGYYSTSVSGGFRSGKLSHFVAAGGKSCDGYRENTDLAMGRIFYAGKARFKDAALTLQAGYMNKSFGANSFYTARYPEQFEQTRTEFASLQADIGKKVRILPSVYWRRHHDRFELFRNQAPAWYLRHNFHMTDVWGGALNFSTAAAAGRTSGGMELRHEQIYSNVLGQLLPEPMHAPGETQGFFDRGAQRQHVSVFLNHQYYRNNFSLSGGLMMHYSNRFGAGLYPGIDAGYKFLRDFRLVVSVHRALRLPTFTDLYYSGPVNVGNPALKPEKSWNVEAGTVMEKKGCNAGAGGFVRMGRQLIDWVRLPEETVWRSENMAGLNTFGLYLFGGADMRKILKKDFILEDIRFHYTWITAAKPESDYISYYILDYLRHKAVVTLRHRIWKNTGASWGCTFSDRAGSYTDPAGWMEKAYEPYVTLDGKVFWEIPQLSIYISATNITNAGYRDFGAIPMPGRWFVCGLRAEIQYR